MKKALAEVLATLGSQEQSHLHRLVLKAHLNLGSYPCSGDCDRRLARIKLCQYCRLEEQVFAPILDALGEIKKAPISGD